MTPTKRINKCLLIIVGLVLGEGVVLYAAGIGQEGLIDQLRADIDLILGVSGAMIAGLVTTIGILWQSLRASQNEFIETLKDLKDKDD
jgi:hypothetical protein